MFLAVVVSPLAFASMIEPAAAVPARMLTEPQLDCEAMVVLVRSSAVRASRSPMVALVPAA